ncbi:MAG: AAA family ATPase, partial [Kangiellaceae bacterium]|nr:AAA family ATPase [Kangiellaceae bacterium]
DLIPEQKIKGLSHGQRVKANLLLVLARRPKLLVLDEPTTGLDPVARQETLRELMDVMMDEDRSILFSSHNTQDIEQLSDKITFIDRGRVVNSKDKETFLEEWRRVRIEIDSEKDLNSINHLVDVKRSGRVAVVTTNKFNESFIQLLKGFGASISSVESLSLEEIFVAEVFSSRGGE